MSTDSTVKINMKQEEQIEVTFVTCGKKQITWKEQVFTEEQNFDMLLKIIYKNSEIYFKNCKCNPFHGCQHLGLSMSLCMWK